MSITLSIIIPCYNAEPYIHELLEHIHPQITDEVEVIVVDDGSEKPFKTNHKWATVIRQKNGGASAARNKGLDKAKGEYVSFIDADDLVADNYVETILHKIETEKFDYCYLSWKTIGSGWNCTVKLNSIDDKFPPFNLCVWNRVYKRSMIGKVRFNLKKLIAEDAEFIREVQEDGKKKAFISDFMYFYRSDVPESLTKKFGKGELDTERVVYYFKHIKADMTYLIDEIKATDKTAEVIVMTERNDIPELERYAMVMYPCVIKGTELRGEATKLFTKIHRPIHTQVVIFTKVTFNIGGIETWIYNFCQQMRKYYDIMVLYDTIAESQLERLEQIVMCKHNDLSESISCDTIIVNRITDEIPANISYKQSIQMVHGCKQSTWTVPQNKDKIICVSDAVKESYEECKDAVVINNMTYPEIRKPQKVLHLISATRLDTYEKGQRRMVELARRLKERNIPFVWLYFSNREIEKVDGLLKMSPTTNITDYLSEADYLVQLSDTEAFCYSIVESLETGIPVITTPLPVLETLGFKDNTHGYILPFETDEWTDDMIDQLLNVPEFEYKWDNSKRIKEWRKLLGNTKPKGDYKFENSQVKVRVKIRYFDMALQKEMNVGRTLYMRRERAEYLADKGFVEIK